MLTAERIEHILSRLPGLNIGVVGDLFLDQYLHLDARLTEMSLETGLDAHQVVDVVNSPGAAGTVINNLVALGVGQVKVLSFIGTDGRGYDLKQELLRRGVDVTYLLETPLRRTPTYTKPILIEGRELNRLDIKNRTPTVDVVDRHTLDSLPRFCCEVDALLVLDQVSEPDCGVITTHVRDLLAKIGSDDPRKLLLVDSRNHLGRLRHCWAKPNERECRLATHGHLVPPSDVDDDEVDIESAVAALAQRLGRPVFCTLGDQGICLGDPFATNDCVRTNQVETLDVPAYPVTGPTDIVGAGDSTSAGIACAYAAGVTLREAAAFANLVASITIQQIGTTGTATPEQVRARWQEITSRQTPT